MGNLLFSPSGRISSAAFMQGVLVLIVIGLVISLLGIVSPMIGALASLVGLVTLWCWVVLWRKRYHDGGKSGWNGLLPIIVWLVIVMVLTFILSSMFVDVDAQLAATEAATEAAEAGDIGGAISAAMAGGSGMTTMGTIVSSLAMAAVSYGIAALFNNMIKADPNDNQYGPHQNAADTFS